MRLRKTEEGIKDSQQDYSEYRAFCYKWQYRLFKTFTHLLNDGSYVSKRNALIFMKKTIQVFPVILPHYSPLLNAVEKLRDSEKGKRNDLSLMAASYATQLKKQQSFMVPTEEFYSVCFL